MRQGTRWLLGAVAVGGIAALAWADMPFTKLTFANNRSQAVSVRLDAKTTIGADLPYVVALSGPGETIPTTSGWSDVNGIEVTVKDPVTDSTLSHLPMVFAPFSVVAVRAEAELLDGPGYNVHLTLYDGENNVVGYGQTDN
jgi:hypothetical protein